MISGVDIGVRSSMHIKVRSSKVLKLVFLKISNFPLLKYLKLSRGQRAQASGSLRLLQSSGSECSAQEFCDRRKLRACYLSSAQTTTVTLGLHPSNWWKTMDEKRTYLWDIRYPKIYKPYSRGFSVGSTSKYEAYKVVHSHLWFYVCNN
jgi:hypothetical protein